MFFIVFIAMLSILHGYVGWKIFSSLNLSSSYAAIGIIFLAILTLLPVLPILFRYNGYETSFLDKLSLIGYTSLGFFTLSFVAFFSKDLLFKVCGFISSFFSADVKQQMALDADKREFLEKSLSIGILTLVGPATAYGFYSARKGPTIINQDIYLKNLPDSFENFTIAQISDLHVGPTIKKPYVEKVVNQISNLNPDLIAITGDMVDGSIDYLRKDLEPLSQVVALSLIHI